MGTTRIPPVTPQQAGLPTRLFYRIAKRRFGEVPEPFAVLANNGKVLVTAAVHESIAGKTCTTLPSNIREIAVYRTARTVGCSWCIDFGAMLMRLEGLNLDKLQHIDEFETSPLYSDDERAAIAYADAMTATPPTVTDEQVTDLTNRFGAAGLVELTYQVALENSRSRSFSALGITDQGFSTGSCRVPWAQD
jgi:alkylhydroperoxidase family enzyme